MKTASYSLSLCVCVVALQYIDLSTMIATQYNEFPIDAFMLRYTNCCVVAISNNKQRQLMVSEINRGIEEHN